MRAIIAVLIVAAARLSAAPPPSAKEILDSVRMLESRQQIDLDGQLREDEKVIPFHLTQNGSLIRYSFSDPDEVLQLRLGENGSSLAINSENGGSGENLAARPKEKERGTGITYEEFT